MSFLNKNPTQPLVITVGARSSPLSQAQVQEVLEEIKPYHPSISFNTFFVLTSGDLNQQISLRTMEKTNFFTKEVDELVLNGTCRIGIHSAKDLPFPIPQGLILVCLTKGIDSSDSLVLREGCTLEMLPQGAIIATSSIRRENRVRELRSDVCFIDLRGTIHQRLNKLERSEADGVVIAEAALIRLNLTHLNRVKLPGHSVEGQGQLAILARENDTEIQQLFAPIGCN